jgi:predicted small metal-binding protein
VPIPSLGCEEIVDKMLTCDCGFIAQAPDDVGLATEVRRHAWENHGMPLSHDEALLLLFHAELAGATAILARPQTATETEEQ